MTHLPFNHIIALLDTNEVERAVAEAAKVVSTYIEEAADFCVYTKGADVQALNDALWRLYTASEPYPSLVKELGKVVWPGNSLFN